MVEPLFYLNTRKEKMMNFVLRSLVLIGISIVLGTAGVNALTWQWWMIMMLIILYTILLALYD